MRQEDLDKIMADMPGFKTAAEATAYAKGVIDGMEYCEKSHKGQKQSAVEL